MKKKILFFTVALLGISNAFAVVTWNGTTKTAWTQGSGTEADPFIISSPNHLAYLAQQVNAGNTYDGVYFKQTDDFNLNSKACSIGTTTYKFEGNYDGNGKYISNLKTSIFGYINNSEIKNLTLQGVDIAVAGNNVFLGASLAKYTNGSCRIINCHNKINIQSCNSHCGGLITCAEGTSLEMVSCTNSGTLKCTGWNSASYTFDPSTICIGGLVGLVTVDILKIMSCSNTGKVNTQYRSYPRGSLIGKVIADNVTIDQCFSNNNISSELYYGNHFIGEVASASCIIQRSYIKGTADYFIAAGNATIKGCYMIGKIYNYGPEGGVFTLSNALCSNCYIAGTLPAFTLISGSEVRWTGDYCFYSPTGSFTPILGSSMYVSTSSIKKTSFIPRINEAADEEYFTMDYEGINDGYPILKWQAGTRYNISATCDADRGSVSGSGEYPNGYSATLTATPKSGCTFVGWSDGNTDNPRTVTVSGEASYIAQFTKSSYTIYVNQDCSGNIE